MFVKTVLEESLLVFFSTRRTRFLIILALFATIYVLTFTHNFHFWLFADRGFAKDDSSLVDRINRAYRREFDRIVDEHCSPSRVYAVNVTCLERLDKLDRKYASLKKKPTNHYHPRLECKKQTNDDENYSNKLIVHTFWKIDDSPNKPNEFALRMLKLNVMSFLATQNLYCSKLIVWKLASSSVSTIESVVLDTFAEYVRQQVVEIRTFDVHEMCRRSYGGRTKPKRYFLNSGICSTDSTRGDRSSLNNFLLSSVSLSDFVRFMVLDLYGGIYVDGDVILLKDLRILTARNFCYRWADQDYYNTAILGR